MVLCKLKNNKEVKTMKMKSLFGALVALGSMALMAVGVQAATTFSAGVVQGQAGAEVVVPVCVAADAGSTDTVNGYIMKVKYDPSELTPVASSTSDPTGAQCFATVGNNFTDGILVADVTSTSETQNVLTVAWAAAKPVTVSDVNDIMATINFEVAETATSSAAIGVEVAALTKDGQTLADGTTYSAAAGEVTLEQAGLLGDVNNDGLINGTDVLLLTQYVNNVLTDIDIQYPGATTRGNVNQDATINGTDVLLLTQFVNNVITSFE